MSEAIDKNKPVFIIEDSSRCGHLLGFADTGECVKPGDTKRGTLGKVMVCVEGCGQVRKVYQDGDVDIHDR